MFCSREAETLGAVAGLNYMYTSHGSLKPRDQAIIASLIISLLIYLL